jgi:AcrR family transcriptional regulator
MTDMQPLEAGVRPPQQRRSRESLERVLRAGEKLLAKKGYEGFTIAEVSRRAKVSVGSVYGRFDNKDALVYAIHGRMVQRMTPSAETAEAIAQDPDLDLRGTVAQAVHLVADEMDGERALLRAFMLRAAADKNIARPGSEASRQLGRRFRSAVLAHSDEIGHPEPELAVDIAYRMVYDVLARHVMYGPTFESATAHPWDELVDELITASVAYLRFGAR